ncbi:condensin complex protein MksE [Flavobacterium sp.]|uniref:condensin complex protein MksE n=1 Tax=Flavobacterium sp. TaxID=239 RepID=UPI003D0BBFF6
MENESNKISLSSFLYSDNSEELFASIDYLLKDGMHIQKQGKQINQFNFISQNQESLKMYYNTFFKVDLVEAGQDNAIYYYLDFINNNRGHISEKHRHMLKSEYVIIGFLIYKIVFIDREIDLESVQKLKEKIRIESEDYKQGIYALIAKSKNTTPGNYNDDLIDRTIQSALEEFKKIGWINLEKDEFHILPAFDRLLKVYEDYIINIDETLNELK